MICFFKNKSTPRVKSEHKDVLFSFLGRAFLKTNSTEILFLWIYALMKGMKKEKDLSCTFHQLVRANYKESHHRPSLYLFGVNLISRSLPTTRKDARYERTSSVTDQYRFADCSVQPNSGAACWRVGIIWRAQQTGYVDGPVRGTLYCLRQRRPYFATRYK